IHRSVADALVMRECQTCEDDDEIRRACASCDAKEDEPIMRKPSLGAGLSFREPQRLQLLHRPAGARPFSFADAEPAFAARTPVFASRRPTPTFAGSREGDRFPK